MSGILHLDLESHGNESGGAPVRVEVLDSRLRTVAERWTEARGQLDLPLEPGTYGVRVSVASGRHVDRVADVQEGEPSRLSVPLFELSPHESHEWAYFSQQVDEPVGRSLADPQYEGAWLRLWERSEQGWQPISMPEGDVQRLSDDTDGISFRFKAPAMRLFVLQTGGPRIPWRCTALPPADHVMVLVKPSAPGASHPLDTVVSSEDWGLQTLLTLLTSGQTATAREWDREASIAEQLLYAKRADPAAAAIGGYFLLKIRDFARLHDWATNLANWFDWMPDGPIIHAWQLLARASAEPARRQEHTDEARRRLLEAISRGAPLYTEGVRLLRDGLLALHRSAKGGDEEVAAALLEAGKYYSLSDHSVPTTTFLADTPDQPDEQPRTGIPEDGHPMMFVFAVPLSELVREGLLRPGEHLQAPGVAAQVQADGTLRAEDGAEYGTLASLGERAEGGVGVAPWNWQIGSSGDTVYRRTSNLLRSTFSRSPGKFGEVRSVGLDAMGDFDVDVKGMPDRHLEEEG